MKDKKRSGYFTLIGVIVAGAIALVLALALVALSSNDSQASFSLVQSEQAKAIANACAETALDHLLNSTTFLGTATVSLGNGTCNYNVVSMGGTIRSITATGNVGPAVRKVSIVLDLSVFLANPQITMSSWQEVGSF